LSISLSIVAKQLLDSNIDAYFLKPLGALFVELLEEFLIISPIVNPVVAITAKRNNIRRNVEREFEIILA